MGMTAVASIALALMLGAQGEPERRVEGLTLMTNDAALATRIEKELGIGLPLDEFRRKFPMPYLKMLPFGRRSLAVLDDRVGPIERLTDAVAVANAFAALPNLNEPVRFKDLPAPAREALEKRITSLGPRQGFSNGAVMLEPKLNIWFSGFQAPVQLSRKETKEERVARDAAFNKFPALSQPDLTASEWQAHQAKLQEADRQRNMARVHLLGIARFDPAEGVRKLGELLESRRAELESQLDVAGYALLRRSGVKFHDGDDLRYRNGMGTQELPADLQKRLGEVMGAAHRALGFESADSATSFLGRQQSFTIEVMMYASWMDRNRTVGDPSRGNPGAAGIIGSISLFRLRPEP